MIRNKKLIPELRFPKFAIDGGWTITPLSEVYSFKITNSFSRDKLNYKKGTVKNIHYGDIHTKFLTLFDITKESVPYINSEVSISRIDQDNYCAEGDIVFADASEDMDDVGKSIEIVNLNNEQLLAGLHTFLVRQIEPNLIVGFGGYLFKSNSIRTQIKRESQGAKVLGISKSRISDIKIYYPENQKEQQKIASCLSSLDELIAAHSDKLDALKDHKKGLMQNLFPQEGQKVPNYRFSEFEKDGAWVSSKLNEVAAISSGGTPSRAKKDYWNGNIPWVSTTLIDFNEIKNVNEFITPLGLENSSTKIFPKGTILMAMYGQEKTRGKVAILGLDATINQACAAITLKKDMNINFVFQNLAARYKEIRSISNQGGQQNLSGEIIKNISIYHPNVKSSEQQKIASCLSEVDELITAQTEQIEQLQQHKKGLMQGLFPVVRT